MPLPAEAKNTLPGFAFAYSTSSATLRAGTDGWTTSSAAICVIRDTGAKSRTASKPCFA